MPIGILITTQSSDYQTDNFNKNKHILNVAFNGNNQLHDI